MSLMYLLFLGSLLFGFGYYLGNQIGRTEHIRDHLRKVSEQKTYPP